MPKEIVEKWVSTLKEIVSDPEVQKKAQNIGKVTAFLDPAGFRIYMNDQYKIYLKLAEAAGIRK